DYPLEGTIPPPAPVLQVKVDVQSLVKIKRSTLDYVKKRGELDQGLKLKWSNTGSTPGREWGYLGYVLNILGETELAKKYFEEAHSAFDERVIVGLNAISPHLQAQEEVVHLEQGHLNTPADASDLVKAVNQFAIEGKLTEAEDLAATSLGLERAVAL